MSLKKTCVVLTTLFTTVAISLTIMPFMVTVKAAQAAFTKDEFMDFSSMTDAELNDYIDNIASSSQKTRASTTGNIGTAWLAAAQIARNRGYECAAKMVEYSVWGNDYSEIYLEGTSGGLFYNKISINADFLSYQAKLGTGSEPTSFAFTASTDADLFYALHNVNVTAELKLPNTPAFSYWNIVLTDIFDFAYDNNYDSLFTSLVNNGAWLCQQTHVLHPINFTLTIRPF